MVGYENLKKRLFDFFEAGIHYLSLYLLSLENVKKRSNEELNYIYKIMIRAVDTVVNESIVKEEKVRFNIIRLIVFNKYQIINIISKLFGQF